MLFDYKGTSIQVHNHKRVGQKIALENSQVHTHTSSVAMPPDFGLPPAAMIPGVKQIKLLQAINVLCLDRGVD